MLLFVQHYQRDTIMEMGEQTSGSWGWGHDHDSKGAAPRRSLGYLGWWLYKPTQVINIKEPEHTWLHCTNANFLVLMLCYSYISCKHWRKLGEGDTEPL